MKKFLSVLTIGCAFLLSACGSKETLSEKQNFTYLEDSELISFDPQYTTDAAGLNVVTNSFEGLYGKDEKENLIPLGAKNLPKKVEEGTYEISLNEKSKWSDGTAVTSDDYLYAFERGIQKDAPYRSLFTLFENGAKVLSGEKAFKELGIKKVDESTLRMTFSGNEKELSELLSLPAFYPVSQKNLTTKGNFQDSDTLVYNGPFTVESLKINETFSWNLVKNPNYWDQKQVKMAKITGIVKENNDVRLGEFNKNAASLVPMMKLSGRDITQDPEYLEVPYYQVGYFYYNEKNPLLNNPDFREILRYATNRKEITTWALGDFSKPTLNLLPNLKGDFPKEWEKNNFDYDIAKGTEIYQTKLLKLKGDEKKRQEALAKLDLTKRPHTILKVVTLNEVEKRKVAESLQYAVERIAPEFQLNIEALSPSAFNKTIETGDYDIALGETLPLVENTPWLVSVMDQAIFKETKEFTKTTAKETLKKWQTENKVNPLYQRQNSYLLSSRIKGIQFRQTSGKLYFKYSYKVN